MYKEVTTPYVDVSKVDGYEQVMTRGIDGAPASDDAYTDRRCIYRLHNICKYCMIYVHTA